MVSCVVTKSFRGLWCGLPGANLLSADRPIKGACHCGAVTFELASRPKWMVSCNCSVCRCLGALWVHAPPAVATIDAPPNSTKTYMWGDWGIKFTAAPPAAAPPIGWACPAGGSRSICGGRSQGDQGPVHPSLGRSRQLGLAGLTLIFGRCSPAQCVLATLG